MAKSAIFALRYIGGTKAGTVQLCIPFGVVIKHRTDVKEWKQRNTDRLRRGTRPFDRWRLACMSDRMRSAWEARGTAARVHLRCVVP